MNFSNAFGMFTYCQNLLRGVRICLMKIKTQNLKEFNAVAVKFAKENLQTSNARKNALIIALSGDLGVGKTHFVKAVARELGIKTRVNSPTFVIMKRYKLKNKNFIHIDAYRLKNEKEILNLGFEELINNLENIIFIEWAENIKKALPKKYLKVKIKHLEGESREISY